MGIVLVLLLIAHMVGDFVFQPSAMAEVKKHKFGVLLLHFGIYSICVFVVLILCVKIEGVWLPFTVLAGMHFIIDLLRARVFKTEEGHRKELALFLADQTLHIASIVFVLVCFSLVVCKGSIVDNLIEKHTYEKVKYIIYMAFVYILAVSPSAVLIKKVLNRLVEGKTLVQNKNSKADDKGEDDIDKSGYLIGILERLLTVTFVLLNQFAALGFVLAAKSLARFKQLEKKLFAEKYLVGTLLSITLALLSTLFIKLFIG